MSGTPPPPESDRGAGAAGSVVPSVAVAAAAEQVEREISGGFEPPAWLRRYGTWVFMVTALGFTAYLLRYYLTGTGGPTLLAVAMVPVAYLIALFDDWRRGLLYPRLGVAGSTIVMVVCAAAAIVAALYVNAEFDAIRMLRLGRWNTADLAAGATLIVLILEYARRKYLPLFVVNIVLIAYVVYGNHVPGLFRHSGMPWERVISSMSLETTSGIFDSLPQQALTLIGSFILVLAVLRAFGAVDSILKATSRLTQRSPHLLPQSAVVASVSIGMVSGSGAANAATTGSITIPALIRAGMPKVRAAAVETAASLGSQLMPPLMGIAAFLIANFLGVSYFEVVARGFAPALIYFAGMALAVYLIAARVKSDVPPPDLGRLDVFDKVNLAAYLAGVAGLIYLMGVLRQPAMGSAQQVFFVLGAGLTVMLLVRWATTPGRRSLRQLARPYTSFVETFARMTAELTLLLSVLGILTAGFAITGVPTRVGFLMLQVAGVSIVLMVLLAFVFGYLLGMGLPPAPTYIVLAVAISPFMYEVGINPWVVHFYAFFIAVFGELSPPTSLTAAVTSRIADASFTRTMFRSIELCLPLLLLMIGVFTWPGLVTEPGTNQILPAVMVLIATIGVTVAVHGHLANHRLTQLAIKTLTGGLSLALLLAPPLPAAITLAAAITALSIYGFVTTRRQVHQPAAT